jgi:hypothetical protein
MSPHLDRKMEAGKSFSLLAVFWQSSGSLLAKRAK